MPKDEHLESGPEGDPTLTPGVEPSTSQNFGGEVRRLMTVPEVDSVYRSRATSERVATRGRWAVRMGEDGIPSLYEVPPDQPM